jgi:hypothetical protein
MALQRWIIRVYVPIRWLSRMGYCDDVLSSKTASWVSSIPIANLSSHGMRLFKCLILNEEVVVRNYELPPNNHAATTPNELKIS